MNASPLSGMRAAGLLLTTAAGNTANANTPGCRAQRVGLATDATGGVTASVQRDAQPGVDLAEQAVTAVTATWLYRANAQMLRASSEAEQGLFDARV